MKKILVPTDFTKSAENGLKLAVDLAKHVNGEITLLNMIYPVRGSSFTAMADVTRTPRGETDLFMVKLIKTNKAKLQIEIDNFKKDNVPIKPEIDFEDKVHGLNKYVKQNDIDMIVIGTKGSKSLYEYLFGTHTENVIKVSDCPVITVKEEPVDGYFPESIVFAVDINNENYHGINELKKFADEFNSQVHFLYVMDDEIDTEEAVSKLGSLAEANKFNDYTINTFKENKSNVEDTIKSFAKRKDADMIAVVSEGKKGIKELLFGSVTNDLINNVEYPVFVMSNEK